MRSSMIADPEGNLIEIGSWNEVARKPRSQTALAPLESGAIGLILLLAACLGRSNTKGQITGADA